MYAGQIVGFAQQLIDQNLHWVHPPTQSRWLAQNSSVLYHVLPFPPLPLPSKFLLHSAPHQVTVHQRVQVDMKTHPTNPRTYLTTVPNINFDQLIMTAASPAGVQQLHNIISYCAINRTTTTPPTQENRKYRNTRRYKIAK